MNKADLIAEITAAFDGVSREDGVTLHEANIIDLYGDREEQAAARLLDTDTRWQDVSQDDLRFPMCVLSYFDPKGFRYYLPAYLICFLNHFETDESTGDLGEVGNVLYDLGVDYPRPFWEDDFYGPRLVLLNQQQSRAVAHFLQYVAEYRESLEAERRQALRARAAQGKLPGEEQAELAYLEREHQMGSNAPKNGERLALDRYWRQFL